ncbi:unnamed protein product [Gordionus sp. m RMFG-2023]
MKRLSFQHKWLNQYTWLSYSQLTHSAYCKVCVIFGPRYGGINCQKLGELVLHGFVKYKHAKEKFSSHEKCNCHQNSIKMLTNLMQIAKGMIPAIDTQLSNLKAKGAKNNCKYLQIIIQAIIYLGRQGMPLRGHREKSGKLDYNDTSVNEDNFKELLKSYCHLGGDETKLIFDNVANNAIYISPDIQNEIINICNNLIVEKLIKIVNKSTFFSVLADETTDISNQQQMSLVIRILNLDTIKISEFFLQFIPLNNGTGENIAKQIISFLKNNDIDITKIRGQGYDGAPAMSGKINGVQAYIKKKCPKALYVHCGEYSQNLVISKACGICEIDSLSK